jgi:hypothetical protein
MLKLNQRLKTKEPDIGRKIKKKTAKHTLCAPELAGEFVTMKTLMARECAGNASMKTRKKVKTEENRLD